MSGLTDEQRRRMDANRLRALEIRAARSQPTSNDNIGDGEAALLKSNALTEEQRLRMEVNRRCALERKQRTLQLQKLLQPPASSAATTGASASASSGSPANGSSATTKSPPDITAEQRERMEENRRSALEKKKQRAGTSIEACNGAISSCSRSKSTIAPTEESATLSQDSNIITPEKKLAEGDSSVGLDSISALLAMSKPVAGTRLEYDDSDEEEENAKPAAQKLLPFEVIVLDGDNGSEVEDNDVDLEIEDDSDESPDNEALIRKKPSAGSKRKYILEHSDEEEDKSAAGGFSSNANVLGSDDRKGDDGEIEYMSTNNDSAIRFLSQSKKKQRAAAARATMRIQKMSSVPQLASDVPGPSNIAPHYYYEDDYERGLRERFGDEFADAFIPIKRNDPRVTTLLLEKYANGNKKFDVNREMKYILAPALSGNSNLKRISFKGCNLSPASVKSFSTALANCSDDTLEEIDLEGNKLGANSFFDELIRVFIGCRKLRLLVLAQNGIGSESCKSLARLLESKQGNLRKLYLHKNSIHDRSAQILANALSSNTKLNVLTLHENRIKMEGWLAVLKILRSNQTLKELGSFSLDKKRALQSILGEDGSECLSLMKFDNPLEDEEFRLFSKEIANVIIPIKYNDPKATTLPLCNVNLQESLWRHIGEIISGNKWVKSLIVHYPKINSTKRIHGGSEIMKCLAPFMQHNTCLKNITFSRIDLRRNCIKEFCAALLNRPEDTLEEIDLGGNRFGDDPMDELVEVFMHCKKTKVLNLAHNGIGPTGCASIARLLKQKQSNLKELHLQGNSIDDESAETLASSLSPSTKLVDLTLERNSITTLGWIAVLKLLRFHLSLRRLGSFLPHIEAVLLNALKKEEGSSSLLSLMRQLMKFNIPSDDDDLDIFKGSDPSFVKRVISIKYNDPAITTEWLWKWGSMQTSWFCPWSKQVC